MEEISVRRLDGEQVAPVANGNGALTRTAPVTHPSRSGGGDWTVRNRTGGAVTITSEAGELVLPPLAQVVVPGDVVDRFGLQGSRYAHVIEVGPTPTKPIRDFGALIKILGVVLAAFFFIGVRVVHERSTTFSIVYWSVATSVLLLAGGGTYFLFRRRGLGESGRVVSQAGSLLGILAIAAGIPLAAAFRFGNGQDLVQGTSFALLGRLEVTAVAIIASGMPALLFFVFDRQRLKTLRRRFEQQIFRLDPRVRTIEDVEAKYGAQIDEAYGAPSPTGSARLAPGTRLPLLIATTIISLGWVLALQPGATSVTADSAADLVAMLKPQQTTMVFGFLGAYYFAINLIVRRYMRGDLKPKAYSMIASRVLVVVVLSWLLDLAAGQARPATLFIAFFAGVIPETAFTYLRGVAQSTLLKHRIVETQPLTMLEGIDLYDRSSLEDEGVTNLQSLVHHDLIELILSMRIPVPRLVDLVDQANLILHLPPSPDGPCAGADQADRVGARRPAANVDHLVALRAYGIRTATDLEAAVDAAERKGGKKRRDALLATFGGASSARSGSCHFDVVLDCLAKGEWMENLRYWHSKEGIAGRRFLVHSNGNVQEVQVPAVA